MLGAFIDLGTERAIGMAIGPIPRSRAIAYAREHWIRSDDAVSRFWALIHDVDNKYLAMVNSSKNPEPEGVDVNDVDGVRQLFAGIKAKRAKKKTHAA